MATTYEETPDWRYEVDEVSASVYQVTARDQAGRNIQKTGTDPEVLLEECKADAIQMLNDSQKGEK